MSAKKLDIDPELRQAATVGRLMIRPARWSFKLNNFLSDLMTGKGSADLGYQQEWVTRQSHPEKLRLCTYRPDGDFPPLPIVLYLHGGGYAMGSPESSEFIVKKLFAARPCVIVAPAYRRSMDAPYPAAIDDCYDALLWVKDNAERLGARSDQICVIGHSAGGGLTAATTLRARDRGDVNIAFQMPLYPMIDDRMTLPSARDNHAPVWNTKTNTLGWNLYLRDLHKSGTEIPYDAAPARAMDYSGLPPTATFIGDLDPFRDETRAYIENLRAAGILVQYKEYVGAFHAFEVLGPKAAVSQAAEAFFADAFAHGVDTCFAAQNA